MKLCTTVGATIGLSIFSLFLTPRIPLMGQQQPPAGIVFQVVSVRVLDDKEASKRAPDFLGSDVAVRLRISPEGRSFYFYTLKGAIFPVGYAVKLTEHDTVWLAGRSGAEKSSPGLQQLTLGMPGSWNLLSGGGRPSLEWEELDSTLFAGEKHARTIFIKLHENDKPVEVTSNPYVVPAA